MPSKSAAQHRLMEAAAHTKGGYGGVPQSVGREFVDADAAKHHPFNPARPEHNRHPMEHEMKAHAMRDPARTPGDTRGGHIEPVTHKGKKMPFEARNPNKLHSMFGPGKGRGSGFEKGGGREHPTGGVGYLRGGSDAPLHASPDHFAEREGHDGHYTGEYRSNDEASARYEGNEFGSERLKHNLGAERKKGYGNPQGGTTSLPATPGAPSGREFDHSMGHKMPEGGMVVAKGMEHEPREDLADETRGTHELPRHEFAAAHHVPQEHRERIAKALLKARHR